MEFEEEFRQYFKKAMAFCLFVLAILLVSECNDKKYKLAKKFIMADKNLHSVCGGVKKISLLKGNRGGKYLFDTYGKYGCKLPVYIELDEKTNKVVLYKITSYSDSLSYYYNLVLEPSK
jgi:hypothetical protein